MKIISVYMDSTTHITYYPHFSSSIAPSVRYTHEKRAVSARVDTNIAHTFILRHALCKNHHLVGGLVMMISVYMCMFDAKTVSIFGATINDWTALEIRVPFINTNDKWKPTHINTHTLEWVNFTFNYPTHTHTRTSARTAQAEAMLCSVCYITPFTDSVFRSSRRSVFCLTRPHVARWTWTGAIDRSHHRRAADKTSSRCARGAIRSRNGGQSCGVGTAICRVCDVCVCVLRDGVHVSSHS